MRPFVVRSLIRTSRSIASAKVPHEPMLARFRYECERLNVVQRTRLWNSTLPYASTFLCKQFLERRALCSVHLLLNPHLEFRDVVGECLQNLLSQRHDRSSIEPPTVSGLRHAQFSPPVAPGKMHDWPGIVLSEDRPLCPIRLDMCGS